MNIGCGLQVQRNAFREKRRSKQGRRVWRKDDKAVMEKIVKKTDGHRIE